METNEYARYEVSGYEVSSYGLTARFPRIAEQDIAASAISPPSTKLKFID